MNNYRSQSDEIIPSIIEKNAETKFLAKTVKYYDEIDSTNTVAKQIGKVANTHGTVVIADRQTAGRGRLGRSWSSPKGTGIWMSMVLQPSIKPLEASMLTLVAALAVNKGIRHISNINCLIKWPNDIVANGKKICGILTEMSTSKEELQCVVVGIGINVNTDYFPEEIQETASSIYLENKSYIDRTTLILAILKYFEEYYNIFINERKLTSFRDEYNGYLVNQNKVVTIHSESCNYEGIALGINDTGALLVEVVEEHNGVRNTTVKVIVAGEVSIRGISGYV